MKSYSENKIWVRCINCRREICISESRHAKKCPEYKKHLFKKEEI